MLNYTYLFSYKKISIKSQTVQLAPYAGQVGHPMGTTIFGIVKHQIQTFHFQIWFPWYAWLQVHWSLAFILISSAFIFEKMPHLDGCMHSYPPEMQKCLHFSKAYFWGGIAYGCACKRELMYKIVFWGKLNMYGGKLDTCVQLAPSQFFSINSLHVILYSAFGWNLFWKRSTTIHTLQNYLHWYQNLIITPTGW